MKRTGVTSILLSGLFGTLPLGCIGNDAILGVTASGGSSSTTSSGGSSAVQTPTGGATSNATGGTTGVAGSPTVCGGRLDSACQLIHIDRQEVNMLLVIDESGSMNAPINASDSTSKWSALRAVLTDVLVPMQNDIGLGLELFPYNPDRPINPDSSDPSEFCAMPSNSAAIAVEINGDPTMRGNNLQLIVDKLNKVTPAGGSPTAAALEQAFLYFTRGNGATLNGSRQVLLATDGGPNCNSALICSADTCAQNLEGHCTEGVGTQINCCENGGHGCLDDKATAEWITRLAAAGISTFVVGLPGSEAYASALNAFARAGNVPNPNGEAGESYYGVAASNSLAGLEQAFSTIASPSIRSCDIPLSESPPDPSSVKVYVDCNLIPMEPDGTLPNAASDGWRIDNSFSPAHLVFSGRYCNAIQTSGAQRIDLVSGCPNS